MTPICTPFFFGPAHRRLYGVHHAPVGADRGHAVLLCSAYGQEAIRLHRLQRVLAERCARQGAHVLRFDCYGCGDSTGEDADGDLAGWARDIAVASDALAQRSGAANQTWLGMRLGATLAALASNLGRPPDGLVLWEPVCDGPAYLAEIAEALVAAIEWAFAFPDPRWRAGLASGAAELHREGVGFEMGALLRRQLGDLLPASVPVPRAPTQLIASARSTPRFDELVERWRGAGARLDLAELDHDFAWMAEEALNSALVPQPVLQQLAEAVQRSGAVHG